MSFNIEVVQERHLKRYVRTEKNEHLKEYMYKLFKRDI
jgi:hypothetical protein